MTPPVFIGVDIGTTSTKAIVFSSTGAIKGMSSQGYPLQAPHPGWAEQDPAAIFTAVMESLRAAVEQAQIGASEVGAIAFSAAMHSLIAMDAHDQPLTRSLTWADSRSIAQSDRLKHDGGFALYQRTGTPIHPMSPLVKLLWLRQQDLETFQTAAKFISIKEYVLFQLLGQYVVDYSIASATGLFNLRCFTWDEAALALAGIRAEQLSQLVPTTHILRGMKADYAEAIGLHVDTPIVVGASDGVLANLGVGAIDADQVAITIGTSAAVRQVVTAPLTDPQGRTFCYAWTENQWVIGGASNSGGVVLRWFRDCFGQAAIEQATQQGLDAYDLLIEQAEPISAGSA
ncbi:MAG TPA: gluconokinase, partial [Coleofasciculaceae cyanobacterium]